MPDSEPSALAAALGVPWSSRIIQDELESIFLLISSNWTWSFLREHIMISVLQQHLDPFLQVRTRPAGVCFPYEVDFSCLQVAPCVWPCAAESFFISYPQLLFFFTSNILGSSSSLFSLEDLINPSSYLIPRLRMKILYNYLTCGLFPWFAYRNTIWDGIKNLTQPSSFSEVCYPVTDRNQLSSTSAQAEIKSGLADLKASLLSSSSISTRRWGGS